MLLVLDLLDWELRESAAVRLTCLRWRNIHDSECKTPRLCYRDGGDGGSAVCAAAGADGDGADISQPHGRGVGGW
jgi:hypothetical protein